MEKNDIINKIQKVRENNNRCWMDILRLAFRTDKEEAKRIFKEITENDKKVNELSKKLCEV